MEKANLTLTFDDEKMNALEFYLKKENATPQKRLEEALEQLYAQAVPEAVREYLDRRSAPPPRSKRPARPNTNTHRDQSALPEAEGKHE